MEPMNPILFGTRVKILEDYPKDCHPRDTIPEGTVGTMNVGPYCYGIFNYKVECPVQFGIDSPSIPETLGVPWELLEFVD